MIGKTFPIRERVSLELRAEAFNITNTPQYGYPNVPSVVGAIQQGLPFGQITNTVNTPRQFQFGARFSF